ncbi:MAG: site-specific integrase [Myxococcales bacterium]|nr:MAG: site-specific integrase [Myxococcales bacterium]
MGVRKRGPNYFIDFYVEGQRVREMIGPNKRQADQVLTQRKAEVLAGKYKLPQEAKTTFSEMADRYNTWAREHKRSWKNDESMLNHLLQDFGDMALSKITPWHIEQVKHRLRQKGLSGPRVNRYLACLSGLFHRAEDWGLAAANPVRRVRRFRENPGRLRYLSREEIPRLLAACEPEVKRAAMLALATGMRRGEIFALRWEDVNLTAGIIHVTNSKSGARREIPFCREMQEALRSWQMDAVSELVLTRKDGRPYGTRMRKAWLRACEKAGLAGLRFHDLRHTFASHLVMAGQNLLAVQELLGHKDLAMTRRYSHLAPGLMREAVQVMGPVLKASSDAEGWAQNGHKPPVAIGC